MMTPATSAEAENYLLAVLRCPQSGEKLHYENGELVSESSSYRYPVTAAGIPLFAGEYWTPEAEAQRIHYDAIAQDYSENLSHPYTGILQGAGRRAFRCHR
jgi:hypothetical protein